MLNTRSQFVAAFDGTAYTRVDWIHDKIHGRRSENTFTRWEEDALKAFAEAQFPSESKVSEQVHLESTSTKTDPFASAPFELMVQVKISDLRDLAAVTDLCRQRKLDVRPLPCSKDDTRALHDALLNFRACTPSLVQWARMDVLAEDVRSGKRATAKTLFAGGESEERAALSLLWVVAEHHNLHSEHTSALKTALSDTEGHHLVTL